MERGVLYNVIPRDGVGAPVGQIKNGVWYEVGQGHSAVRMNDDGSIEIAGHRATIVDATLIRESDGEVFDLVPVE